MTINQFDSEIQAAIRAAIAATDEILDVYVNDFDTIIKSDGSPVTEADYRSSQIIEEFLAPTKIPIIGEEMKNRDFKERKDWHKCWVIDPVDGTREFVNRNDEFAINIALVVDEKPVFGLIASPVEHYMMFGGKEMGLFQAFYTNASPNIEEIDRGESESSDSIVVLTSRSHDSGMITDYLDNLEAEYGELTYLRKGSALKFIDLVKQKAHSYPRFAPTMEWDIAAGQALLEAAGGTVLNAETGLPLTYNKPNLYNPFFVAENLPG